jgi:hypothetical protein
VSFVDLAGERAPTALVIRPGHEHPAIDALRRIAIEVSASVGGRAMTVQRPSRAT